MDDRLLIMLAVSVGFGLIIGPFVARISNNKEKIHGGLLSQLFHFIAVVLFRRACSRRDYRHHRWRRLAGDSDCVRYVRRRGVELDTVRSR